MTLTLKKLQEKFLRKIQKQYQDSYIKDGVITINKGIIEVTIPLGLIYSDYLTNNSFKETFKNYLTTIGDSIIEKEHPVNYHNIYPIIRNKDFEKEIYFPFHRKSFCLDLDILIAEDEGILFRFCGNCDNIDVTKAYESAMFNVNRLKNELYQVNSELNIFGVKTESDYAASLILNTNFKKQIREKIGKTFLITIPSSSWILVAPNQSENILVLKDIIKLNDDPNTISSRVYRVKGNMWEYAD